MPTTEDAAIEADPRAALTPRAMGPVSVLAVRSRICGWAKPFVLLVALALLAVTTPATAKPQQATNSHVVLDLPPGYVAAELFSGFQNESFGASFVILEVPRKAYAEMAAGFTPSKLAARGIRDVAKGTLPREDEHVYMQGRQSSPAGDYAKYFMIFKEGDLAVLVSANVPQTAIDAGAIKVADIEKVLTSAHVTAMPAVREIFDISYLGPFKPAGRLAGTSRLFTPDGQMEPATKGALRPAFMIAPSIDKVAVANPSDLASRLLQTLAGLTSVTVDPPRPIVIAGLAGTETTAQGRHEPDGTPMRLYQVVLAGRDGGYFRMIGMTPAAQAETLMPQFKRMAASFQPRD